MSEIKNGITMPPVILTGKGLEKGKAVTTYKSKYRGLQYMVQLKNKAGKGEHVTVHFSDGTFTTTREDIIHGMDTSPGYGGSIEDDFKLPEACTSGPVFWKGDYPKWYKDEEKRRADGTERVQGHIEPILLD